MGSAAVSAAPVGVLGDRCSRGPEGLAGAPNPAPEAVTLPKRRGCSDGTASRVSQAVTWVGQSADSKVLDMKASLIECHARSRYALSHCRTDHQVKMVAHQAVGMHRPVGLLAGLGQRFHECLRVHSIRVGVLAPASAAHYVMNGPRNIDAQLTRHKPL